MQVGEDLTLVIRDVAHHACGTTVLVAGSRGVAFSRDKDYPRLGFLLRSTADRLVFSTPEQEFPLPTDSHPPVPRAARTQTPADPSASPHHLVQQGSNQTHASSKCGRGAHACLNWRRGRLQTPFPLGRVHRSLDFGELEFPSNREVEITRIVDGVAALADRERGEDNIRQIHEPGCE